MLWFFDASRDKSCTLGILSCFKQKVADLLISILYNAALADPKLLKHTLDPYPSGVGYFNSQGEYIGFKEDDDIKLGATRIVKLLGSLPAISELSKVQPEDLDSTCMLPFLTFPVNNIDFLLSPLLKWVLRSGYARITEDVQIEGLNIGLHFRMENANAENERLFSKAFLEAGGESIYGFHGSRIENWHSILHNGFNADRTLNGRAHGIHSNIK
jgi:hypothetical protein